MEVKSEGKPESKIWLIGEAPGANEEKQGRPFVGGAGQLLDGVLREAGIERSNCYIDNVMQIRPSGNDFGKYYLDKSRRQPSGVLIEGQQRIKKDVLEHRPNVVVCLGNEPLYAITGLKGIMNWRGSILDFNGIKVIPSIHPAMIMRQYEWRPISVMDFKRVKTESEFPEHRVDYKDNFIINPTFDVVLDTIREMHSRKYLTFDIETDMSKQDIMCIGFAWSKQDAICIPMFFKDSNWWTSEEHFFIIRALKELFANPGVNFIAQNAQFDLTYIKDKWHIEVANLWLDTMIGFHCVYPELRKSLAFLTSIYTKRPYHKGMVGAKGVAKGAGPDNLWTYNCFDVVTTYECAMAIWKELEEHGTQHFYTNHSHRLIKPLMEIQRRGIRIDVGRRSEIDANLCADLEQLGIRLESAVGHPLNVASPKQMKAFLYEELKFPPQRKKDSRGKMVLTANADAIEALAKKFPNPVFELILDIRRINKLLSTYVRATVDKDERMRCSYVITGTETGRLSSRESIYGSGTNMQNIPRGELIRGFFIPDDGKIFINADLSQAEARVVAYIAGETRLQSVFESGGDIHKRNASMVYRKGIAEVTKGERQLAKTLVHAANYGIGARTFGRHIGKSEGEARGLLNQYYALYPSIKLWHKEVEAKLRSSRILRTPFGRARIFFGRWGQDLLREAIAYVPQSTVSDLINKGIIRAWDNLPQGWEIILQVHDSILAQVPVDTAPLHIWKFFKHYFEIPIPIGRKELVIPIDIKIGKNWGSMKELEV